MEKKSGKEISEFKLNMQKIFFPQNRDMQKHKIDSWDY